MYSFYKGYVPTKDKKALMPFKGKSAEELLTLNEVDKFPEFGGVLNDNSVLVDVDDPTEFKILLEIVQKNKVKCRVYKSNRGGHFMFLNNGMLESNKTHNDKWMIAVGLKKCDIKLGTRTSYEILKINGKHREIVYDINENEDYESVPKWLTPVSPIIDFNGLENGDGRNQTMFNYILTLQSNAFTKSEIKETINLINKFVFSEPMDFSELKTVTRDEAFKKPTFFKNKEFLFDKFAKFLQSNNNIIKINGLLHIYRDGIYKGGNTEIESEMIKHIPTLTKAKRSEVLAYLDILITKDTPMSDACYIAFKNGIYNLNTNTLQPFSPDIVITNKIPHNYVPLAYSELMDKTLDKLAVNDINIRRLLEESIGYTFYRRNELRKSFILTGDKRNGKSTYLDMLNTLLGKENTTALDMAEIGDRFKTAELVGKLACIGDDIEGGFISKSALFRKMVSGDRANVERKGKDPFDFSNYSKLFFSANVTPKFNDRTGSIVDRLEFIPFMATFSKKDPDFDPYIKYKLRSEECMEYLIVLGIEGLKRVLSNYEFSRSDKSERELEEYKEIINPILIFFKDLDFEVDIQNQPTKYVYDLYNSFCIENGLHPMSNIEFSKQVKKYYGVDNPTKSINGKKCRVFVKP